MKTTMNTSYPRSYGSAQAMRYVCAMVVMLFSLGVGNVWGNTHSTHYGKAVLQNATGHGTVYLSTASGSNTGQTSSSNPGTVGGQSWITWNCGESSGNDSKTYYARGTANDGYYYAGWATSASATSYTAATTGNSFSASSTTSGSPTTTTIYGYFLEVTVGSPSPASKHFDATDNSVTCTDYSADISFTTTADAKADFKNPVWSATTGHGSFANTWTVADGKATFTVTFTGDGTYGGNVASGSRSRTSSTTLTLTALPGNNSNSCTITASFPNIIVSAGSASAMTTINTTPKTADVTFPVQWADDKDDFTAAFSEIDGGGAWTVNSISYAATDASSGTITVNYTFDPQSEVGDHSAKLTLSANSNAGGASNNVVISAEAEALAENDASVTYNETTTQYNTLAAAITAANSQPGAVVKLLRNIPVDDAHKITSPISVTGAMTLNLNSYTIEKTGLVDGNARVFDINMSSASSVFAIMDSRTGGKIRGVGDNNNNLLTTVYVTKGVLSLASGEIECVNTNTGANAKATGIRTLADAKLLMTGGTITATSSGSLARGVYTKTAPGTENYVVITGGTINVTGATQATGIDCESTSTTVDDPTKASVVLSGVTVNVETTGTTDAIAIRTAAGVSLGIQSGTYNATAATQNTYAIHSSGYTAVVNGTFNAISATRTAFAVYVNGGITAVKAGTFTASAATTEVHATKILDKAKLLTYGGTFRGICTNVNADSWATGTQVVSGGTLEAQGGTFIGEIAKTGLGAAQLSYGVGIYANTGSNVSLSSATLRGQTDNTYLNGGHAFYTKTANAVNITNCTLEVSGQYQYGYGIRNNGTPLSVKNSEITVNTQYAYNYGIYQEGNTTTDVENTTITCEANSVRAHAIWVNNGQVNATNCSLTAKTKQATATAEAESNLRAVYVNTGKKVSLNGCTVTAKGNANYSQNGYGLYIDGSADIDNTVVTVSDVKTNAYAIGNTANTTLVAISSGKFSATAAGGTVVSTTGTAAAAKQQLYGGYYKQNTNLSKYLPAGYGIETLPSGSTEYGEGYRYAIRPTTAVGDPVCKIGSTPYTTLEEALEYASKNASSSNNLTILMVANYTLPTGNYTLPQYTTLLVPMSGQTSFKDHPDRVYDSYSYPTCYKKLTFAEGVHMDVYGTIQTGGKQSAKGQISQTVTTANNGTPTESYGWIYMSAGSTITLEDGSQLYSWGYVTGARDEDGKYLCEIDAKRGSTVHESFQIKDWRGGSCTSSMNGNSQKVFPLNQYYIQNIECPVKFRPGSAELCDGTVSAGSACRTFEDVKLIGKSGTNSMFMMADEDMSEDTWVRKFYDVTNDKQVYEINSSASIGSISLKLYALISYVTFTSSSYVLPLTNNMKIHLLTGSMQITQNTELLPGAEIEVDKEATAYINSGKSLYIFDIDEWNEFYTNEHTFPLPYSPSWAGNGKTCPRSRKVTEDASINVHGKFVVNGAIYTTAGGANIYSSNEDAGTITFNVAAPTAQSSVYVANNTEPTYTERKSNSAYLKNGDGTYEHTAGTVKNKSWIYYEGKWNCWEEHDCFGYDSEDHPYAKPKAYVQLTSDVADANHLYHDAETGERAFIVEDGCTWWEVEPTPYDGNKYKCIDPDYDGRYKYYEYVSSKWQEAKVTVTWKSGSTTLATYDKALYGVSPKYLEGAPSKAATASEYYTWLGWTKDDATEGEFYAKEEELPIVTENTTFYAYFETHKFEYTITFRSESGAVLEAKRWAHGETPIYEGTPTKPSTVSKEYTFTGWSPAIAPATAAATYTAQFSESARNYTIQWVNYNGTVLKEEQVAYGTTPSAPVTPTRPNDTYYTYTFDAWSPAISAVTGNQTYTATYDYEKKVTKYTVTFKNGSETVYSQNLKSGETPVFDGTTPTKDATAQYTYTFDGWSTTSGGALAYATDATLPALTADVTYYAHFASTTNTYSVYWRSEDGKTLLHTDNNVAYGAATPVYDGATTPTKPRIGTTQYVHDGWSATIGGTKVTPFPAVSGNTTYYAHFSEAYEVNFDMQDHGEQVDAQVVLLDGNVEEPSAPTATGYIFGGWYKEAACTNAWNFASDEVAGVTTLYAKWTAKTYDITLDNESPTSAGSTSVTLTYNSSSHAAITNPGKTGYAFAGWWTGDNGTGTLVINNSGVLQANVTGYTGAGGIWTKDVTTTLYAKWTAKTYTVTLDMQSGSGGSSSVTATYDAAMPSATMPTRTGYTFGGYYAAAGGSGTQYYTDGGASAHVWDVAEDASVYAKWIPNTNTAYTVKHYKQQLDGTYSSTPDDTDNLTGTTATEVTPARKSYAGFTAPDGQTVTILADGSRVVEYKYTRNSYTLAWTTDGDDLTGTYTSGSTLYEAYITAPETPTKTGYTFAAWSPTPAATMPAEDTEYAATWTPNTDTKYTVKHWQQNLADDDYTEVTDDREELEGTTATTTAATANTYTGFTAQPISQGTIAADGSAVVNVYYNRNKYTITWLDGDSTTIKTDANVKYGATPSYDGSTPTKTEDDDCTYSFAGMWTPAFETVTGDQSYTALFNAALKGEGFGTYLDIVDWTESTLTINANGWLASGWPYTINGVAYLKSDRADDRTLTIPYSGSADEEWGIIVRKTGGVNFSGRSYTIPHIYNSSATLSGTTASSVIFVRGGSLTVAADATVGAIYVAPEAELIVNEDVTLTVDSLMLRTTAWKAASLENNGTITSDKTYYTRIVAYSGGYQQFALPLSSSISGMRLSNSDKSVYGKTWILKSYNEASRAANGNISTEEISNWDVLTEETNTISATVGYEMFSNSQYYREYYFPVTLPIESVTTVAVSRTENGAAGKSHAGWNAICSPLLGKFTQDFGNNPEDGLKVSELTEDGRYWQHIPEVIHPAVPFYYQAPHSGNLDFSGSAMSLTNAPRRSWNTSIPTQWLRLSINDINGKMLDETNIYSHPEKFSVAYEAGYDVAKQSMTGGRAAIYAELACGKLAFAAIPDSLAATRIPLTIYAGAEGEYVFAMVQNKYIARLQYVLLHDTETGAITDLMSGSYTTELTQGTTADRFYIECVFHEDAPSVATDIEETDAPKKEVGQKIIYNEKIFILYRGRVYDITGRQCELH